MTDELFDAVRSDEPSLAGFWKFPPGFDTTLAAWSKRGPVAYVEADYFGGHGTQTAAVWKDGTLVALHTTASAPALPSPISKALRQLGVVADNHTDEFEAVGLNRHRSVEDWLDDAA